MELECSLGRDELAEWAAYYRISHFGERRADLRSAHQVMTMCRLWGKNAPADIEKYNLFPDVKPKRQQTVEEQQAALLGVWGMTRKDAGWE